MLSLFFGPENGDDVFLSKRRALSEPHGVPTWKATLLISTAVTTSDPAQSLSFSVSTYNSQNFRGATT